MKQKNASILGLCLGILLMAGSAGLYAQGEMEQGKKMMKPMDGSQMAMSELPFAEALGKIKQTMAEENLMVLDDLDGQAMMKMAGKEIPPMHQIIFFHPRYMKKVYEANQMAGIAVPLKLIVMERNGKTVVRYFKPSDLLKPYKGTEAVAKELDEVVARIVGSIK